MDALERLKNIRSQKIAEAPIIRPPNEKDSLLLRVTRGCSWNRCKFCGVYDFFKQEAGLRNKKEVLEEIEELSGIEENQGKETAFLGDADPISMETSELEEIITLLYQKFPTLKRVTVYARAATLWRKREELEKLRKAGLTRVHVGLETGYDYLLKYHRKGINKKRMIQSGKKTRESGIELSYYVLLGLGGKEYCGMHVEETADVLNEVKPEFVRFRKLWIHQMCELAREKEKGVFIEQTPEGTVYELRQILDKMDFRTTIESLHQNNYVLLYGHIPEQKHEMLEGIDKFLALPIKEKEIIYNKPGAI